MAKVKQNTMKSGGRSRQSRDGILVMVFQYPIRKKNVATDPAGNVPARIEKEPNNGVPSDLRFRVVDDPGILDFLTAKYQIVHRVFHSKLVEKAGPQMCAAMLAAEKVTAEHSSFPQAAIAGQ